MLSFREIDESRGVAGVVKWAQSLAVVPLVLLLGTAPPQTTIPHMTPQQIRALFTAAGFQAATGPQPLNRCGQPANPKVTFIDMNDDKQPEALFIDTGACYRPDGRWYAIVTRTPDGNWRRVLEGTGTIQTTGTAYAGWFVFNATSGGKVTRLRYSGSEYAAVGATPPRPAGGRPAAPNKAAIDFTHDPVFKDEAANAASVKALTAAQRTALFRAAGMRMIGKGKWTACYEDTSGRSEAEVVAMADLNGDGRKEVLLYDNGTFCNGMAGVHSYLLTESAPGQWRAILDTQGFATPLKSKGADGYPDMEVDVPGFCSPYQRYGGKEYALIASLTEDTHRPCGG